MGDRKPWAMLAAVALLATACNDSTPPPTLATATTAPTTVASSVTTPPTTAPPTTTTSTTSTSTTQSPDARFAEIERMAQEASVGRLRAIYDRDPTALLAWVGSQTAYDNGVEIIEKGTLDFVAEPDNSTVGLTVVEVLLDRSDCVAASVEVDARLTLGPTGQASSIYIWFPGDGVLKLAEVWQVSTPVSELVEDCDLIVRSIDP